MAPLFSVVTPSYNQCDFIGDTLDSIKNQRYPDIEHLVIDGESTDSTTDVLRAHEDDYDLSWTSEPDEGQSDAINKGFDRSSGDIVGWLNSDDVYFDSGVVSRVVDYFERSDADVIYGDLCVIDGNSRIVGLDIRPDFDPRFLRFTPLIGQPATFFRREVVEAEKLDTTLEYTMDYEYWLRLSRDFSFEHVPDILAGFRVHGEQKTTALREDVEAEAEAMLERYHGDDHLHGEGVAMALLQAELSRIGTGLRHAYRLSRRPPDLAFHGELAPIARLVPSILPDRSDLRKASKRWLMSR